MATKNYHAELIKELADPKEAAAYLSECLKDSEEVFLLGLRNVVEARGGVAALAKKTDLNRVTLYRSLSKRGNPTLASLSAILSVLGIELRCAATK